MSKVTINGECFEWDSGKQPLSEALAIENTLKMRFDDWQAELRAGSAHALAGFIWLVWRRNGRDVPWADLEAGNVEVDMASYKLEADEGEEADPTIPGPEASSTTAGATSGRSASSGSDPGKSPSSRSGNSRP